MTGLRNQRHERFARELAAGRTATEAYKLASGKHNRRYASQLGQRPDITGRVAAILAEKAGQDAEATAKATASLAITKEWLIARTEEARALAMANNFASAALRGLAEEGRVLLKRPDGSSEADVVETGPKPLRGGAELIVPVHPGDDGNFCLTDEEIMRPSRETIVNWLNGKTPMLASHWSRITARMLRDHSLLIRAE